MQVYCGECEHLWQGISGTHYCKCPGNIINVIIHEKSWLQREYEDTNSLAPEEANKNNDCIYFEEKVNENTDNKRTAESG